MNQLEINNLTVAVEGKEIIKDLSLTLEAGQLVVIMGPNGSGKTTLANTLAGHPKYQITGGQILLNGEDMTELSADKRAKLGLFLSMQYAPEIPGVTVANFLRQASNAKNGKAVNPIKMHKELVAKMGELNMDPAFLSRYLNVGLSGGEKKKLEVLQLSVLQPTFAILDETDSGLDVDALRIVSSGINDFLTPETGALLITHYNRILQQLNPNIVHIMANGKIVKSGGPELAEEVEKNGYSQFVK